MEAVKNTIAINIEKQVVEKTSAFDYSAERFIKSIL